MSGFSYWQLLIYDGAGESAQLDPGEARGSVVKHSMSVSLGVFARKALVEEETRDETSISASVVRAVRCYLNDKGLARPGWRFPSFLRDRGPSQEVELELSIDDDLWESLKDEAKSQGVSMRQMLEHAVLYFAAELNAGRVTQRILVDREEEGRG